MRQAGCHKSEFEYDHERVMKLAPCTPQQFARRKALYEIARGCVGDVLPSLVSIGAQTGVSRTNASDVILTMVDRGILDVYRTTNSVHGVGEDGNPHSVRIFVVRVGTDAEFAAAFPLGPERVPRVKKERVPKDETRKAVLVIAKLAHREGALLPMYPVIASQIGRSLPIARHHVYNLIGDGAIKIEKVWRDGRERLRVVSVAA